MTQDQARVFQEEAAETGTEAYIYGYPLVTMEMTRRLMTNEAEPGGLRAPIGQFAHARAFPPADVQGRHRRQRRHALLLGLAGPRQGAVRPQHPGRRGPLLPDADAGRLDRRVPGPRQAHDRHQGPDHTPSPARTGRARCPQGVTEYKSPTNMVWILGRTYSTGTPEDYKAHAFQDKFALVPLSAYGKDYTPPKGKVDPNIDMKTPTQDQVTGMDAAAYFKLLATLMKDNPPAKADAPMVAKMAKIGLVPGKDFDIGKLDPAVAAGLEQAPKAALAKIAAHVPNAGKVVNGWVITKPGRGLRHRLPAAGDPQLAGPGCNRPEDCRLPDPKRTATASRYSGANRYVMHFAKGQLPPVDGFWSLTMYDGEGFFVPNPLDRVHLSSARRLQLQRGRVARPVRPERLARQGQGGQLAAVPRRATSACSCGSTGRPRRLRRSSTGPGCRPRSGRSRNFRTTRDR